jgi:hypothetical protein
MCPSPTLFLFALISGPLLSLETAAAQKDQKEVSPLNVTAQFSTALAADCSSGGGLVAQLQYTGAQLLRGYLVRLQLADSTTGKVVAEQTIQEARDSREPMIVTGAEWTRTFCSIAKTATGAPVAVTAKIDVLKFADGSIWGPASLPDSHRLIGTMDGMDFGVKMSDLERFVTPIPLDQGPLPREQIQFQTIGPLRFESGVWRDDKGKEMLGVEATNLGSIAIRGYVFTESFFDPATGNRLRRVTTKQLETHGDPTRYLLPGASWVSGARKFSYLPDGSLATYTITLDLVVFADGSTFGPRQSRESDEVLGMFLGIDTSNPTSQGTFKPKQPKAGAQGQLH